jgi:hypothetical protein
MTMSRSGFSKGLDLFGRASLLVGFFASDGQYRNWNYMKLIDIFRIAVHSIPLTGNPDFV